MNLNAIKEAVTNKTARQVLLTQKHSPKILFVAGTVGVVTAAVLACRATLKVSETLDKFETEKDVVLKEKTDWNFKGSTDPNKDYDRELNKLKVKTALDIAKPYLPAIGLGIVSIGALTGSHIILTKRNGAIMAAYAALDQGFKEYRERVRQEYGSDTDHKFATGAEDVAVTEKMADGTEKMTLKTSVLENGTYKGGSPYAVCFDESSGLFSREPGRNADILIMRQQWATDKLRARGHLFLNEVFDLLELPHTQAGAIVGWVYDPNSNTSDNYVSFGVHNGDHERVEAFLDGKESSVWLDFNVDGVIWNKI